MKKTSRFFVFTIILFVTCGNFSVLFAQRGGRTQGNIVEVKIASPVPKESPWGVTLDRIAAEWIRISNNEVRVRILHNGQEGGEGKMLSSLASNNIQAAVLTSFGLSTIAPEVMTISVPFLIRNDGELEAVLKEVQGDLEAHIRTADYHVLAWSKAGWVNIFSKDPVFVPDDLRRLKVATNAEAGEMNTAFKMMGFNLVEVDYTDVGTKMMTGAVTAVYQSPAAVAAYRLHQMLKNMASINIAPFMGGIVMNKVTWDKINPSYRDELIRVTRRIAAELDASMQRTINNALTVMVRDGLKVNQLSSAQEQIWYNDVERVIPGLLGITFDRTIYQKIEGILKKYRSGR